MDFFKTMPALCSAVNIRAGLAREGSRGDAWVNCRPGRDDSAGRAPPQTQDSSARPAQLETCACSVSPRALRDGESLERARAEET